MTYAALRNIYWSYWEKRLNRDQAAEEKRNCVTSGKRQRKRKPLTVS